jgi:hypothetical protein
MSTTAKDSSRAARLGSQGTRDTQQVEQYNHTGKKPSFVARNWMHELLKTGDQAPMVEFAVQERKSTLVACTCCAGEEKHSGGMHLLSGNWKTNGTGHRAAKLTADEKFQR